MLLAVKQYLHDLLDLVLGRGFERPSFAAGDDVEDFRLRGFLRTPRQEEEGVMTHFSLLRVCSR
jgi:hypothetical protein